MKSLKFLVLTALFSVIAMVANATGVPAVGDAVYKEGLKFIVQSSTTVYFAGVANNTKGKALKAAKTVEVPASVTVTVDDEDYTFKVLRIIDAWPTGELAVTDAITTLTINVDNFDNAFDPGDLQNLTALETLTVKTAAANALVTTFPKLDAANNTLKKVDLSASGMTAIANAAFYQFGNLEEVKLPATVTTIDSYTFYQCSKLATINLADVKVINNAAFFQCEALQSVDLSAVTNIANGDAFNGCGIETLTLPANLVELGTNAFANNPITTLNIEIDNETLTTFPDAFAGCTTLETVKVKSTKLVGFVPGAFAGCTALTTIDLSEATGMESIGGYVFNYAPALAEVILPETVTEIGTYAFYSCPELTTINLESVKTIGAFAFAGCGKLETVDLSAAETLAAGAFQTSGLTSVTLPAVKSIGSGVFANCALTAIDLTGAEELSTFPNDAFPAVAYESVKLGGTALTTLPINLGASKETLSELVLPDGLTIIGANWFNGFTALTAVTLPEELVKIEDQAFMGSALTTIAIPAKVESIGNHAFYQCADLASVDLSAAAALNTIGVAAFSETAITSIDVPETVTTLGSHAFENCAALTTATGFAGLIAIPEFLFAGCEALTAFTIPAEVTAIYEDAFNGCAALATVTANEKLVAIYGRAFKDCTSLESLDLSGTVLTTVRGTMFAGCTALKEVLFPETLVDLYQSDLAAGLFADCILESLDAPQVNTIHHAIFAAGPNTTLKNLVLGDVTVWDNQFENFTALETVELGDATIGDSSFKGCTALATVTMGDGTIGVSAFEDCTALTTVTLGDVNIDPYAFADCTALTTVTAGIGDINYAAFSGDAALTTVTKDYGNIAARAFENCSGLTDFEWGAAETSASTYPYTIAAEAFYYCTGLTSFTFMPVSTHPKYTSRVNDKAFLGCKAFVVFNTNSIYMRDNEFAPQNTKWAVAEMTIKTVADKGTSGKFFGKYHAKTRTVIDAEEGVKVFSVYVDNGVAVFAGLRTYEGQYKLNRGDNIIVVSDEAKEITVTPNQWTGSKSIAWDEIYCPSLNGFYHAGEKDYNTFEYEDGTYTAIADFQDDYVGPGEYVYQLTNSASNGGFGFTWFGGTKMKDGNFFIISEIKPAAASARLQTIWLDEDGNVINDDKTAITEIESNDVENGAIYNLQGIRVKTAQKGIFIQNGKKYVK